MGFTVKRGSEKGSQKGFWEGGECRRCPERPLVEYAPLGVHPKKDTQSVVRPLPVQSDFHN